MKHWCDSEIEHIAYCEGCRAIPYQYPAAIIKDDDNYVEIEIIPGTTNVREYFSSDIFETKVGLCVDVERRIWHGNSGMFVEVFTVALENFGYDEEPIGILQSFDNAMDII